MSRELLPLKIKIGIKTNRNAKYPNFNLLETVRESGMDWAVYVDVMGDGHGWHYDQTSGHGEESQDSSLGEQWGMLILPEDFVYEAIGEFPDSCSLMTEAEAEDFYNNKAHARDTDQIINKSVLEEIKLKRELDIDLTDQQLLALDSNNSTPGITKNPNKTWDGHKTLTGITIKK